jgi:HPt (histidine-containing phosphotransfer) domain-containing protein
LIDRIFQWIAKSAARGKEAQTAAPRAPANADGAQTPKNSNEAERLSQRPPAPVAESNGCAAFDYQALLARCMGNQDLVRRLLRKFAEQIEGDLASLRQSLAEKDALETAKAAHKIKGATANLTIEAVRKLVAGLEEQARAGVLEHGERTLAQLEQAVADARDEIHSFYS